MKTVAFVTYNTVGTENAGWHEGQEGRRALVLQNTAGLESFADFHSERGRVRGEIARLWTILTQELPRLDAVVIYVGTSDSEKAIELVTVLDPSKVVFVLCDCGLYHKIALIESAGFQRSRRILCECRGVSTMGRLLQSFLTTGDLK